jgi:transposase
VDLETLLKRLEALEAENAELRARLAKYEKQDSSNSNQPPSTDRFKKNQSLRKKSSNKSGGQSGHKGTTRYQSTEVTETIQCNPDSCSKCGTNLVFIEGKITNTRQEFDVELPEAK